MAAILRGTENQKKYCLQPLDNFAICDMLIIVIDKVSKRRGKMRNLEKDEIEMAARRETMTEKRLFAVL